MPTAAFPMHRIVSSCWTPISSPAKAKLLSEYTLTNARGRDRIGKRRPTRTYHGSLASGGRDKPFRSIFLRPAPASFETAPPKHRNRLRKCGPKLRTTTRRRPLIHRKFHRLSGKPPPAEQRESAANKQRLHANDGLSRQENPFARRAYRRAAKYGTGRRSHVSHPGKESYPDRSPPRRHPDFRQKTLPIHRPGVPRSPLSPAQRRKTPHAAKGYPPFSRTFRTCRRAGTIRPSPFREKNRAFRPKRKLRRGIGSYGRRPDRSGRFPDRRKQKNRPPHLFPSTNPNQTARSEYANASRTVTALPVRTDRGGTHRRHAKKGEGD